MRNTVSFASLSILLLSGGLGARTFEIAALPQPVYADTEVSTNISFASQSLDRRFRLELDISPSVSNAVEIAFGTDANSDGDLDRAERELFLGWDCGSWYCRDILL